MDYLKFDGHDAVLDIADSSLVYYTRARDTVNVCIELWDESQLDLHFQDVVLIHDCLAPA